MPTSLDLHRAVDLFGLGDLTAPAEPVGQAWSNDVFRVRTTTGAYAVKLFPPALSPGRQSDLTTGMAFERAVLEAGTVPVPEPVPADGEWLVRLDTPSGPRLARCHRWVAGRPVVRPLPAELVQAAGRHLGVLHAMRRPGGNTSQVPALDLERWAAAVRDARTQHLAWADRLAALTPLVVELAAELDVLRAQRRPMRVSHRDYDPKNAVVDATGRLVVTDWDHAGPVLPDVELYVAATSFADTDNGVAAFVDAYRAAGGDASCPDRTGITVEAADLDWLLRTVEACASGGTPAQHDRAADLVAELPTTLAAMRAWPERFAALDR